MNRLCKLCYRHQTVPESAQIEDCYRDWMVDPVYCGESTRVFKGSYQERPVAVKVVQLYSSNRDETLRVGVLVMPDNSDGLSDVCGPEILQRGDDLEAPPTSKYPSAGWGYA